MPGTRDEQPIGEWMKSRWDDLMRLAHGHPKPAPAGPNSPRPQAHPTEPRPIQRGDRGVLKDDELANIIFNETRSLSGPGIDDARVNLSHAIMNGDETRGRGRPLSAPTEAQVPVVERGAYASSLAAVGRARAQRANGIDPTDGATHFNFRPNNATGPFKRQPLHTQAGAFQNTNPRADLPKGRGVYSNTYQD